MHTRHCPLCGWEGSQFLPFGNSRQRRKDAYCPGCQSVERHRLAYLLLRDDIGRGHRTLHIAPEPSLKNWLTSISSDYLSIGLGDDVMRRMDLTRLDLPDRSRSLIWCSHVLEHIEDDRSAMGEIHRVLAPGGLAVIQAPVYGEETYEDFSIKDEAGRLEAFLQADHVRIYGRDITARLRDVGFDVTVRHTDDLPRSQIRRHALARPMTNEVFVCRRIK